MGWKVIETQKNLWEIYFSKGSIEVRIGSITAGKDYWLYLGGQVAYRGESKSSIMTYLDNLLKEMSRTSILKAPWV